MRMRNSGVAFTFGIIISLMGVHVLAKDKLQKYESYLDWKSAAWTCINNVGGPLVNLDKVPFNWTVWDKLKTAIAPGDLYWIGGYKAHTPFFWLYGCYDFIPHVENSTKYSMLFDNSVRTCSENCGSNVTFIGLKGFLCYCIHNDVSSIKSLLASKCDNKCINDVSSRDVCGSLDGSVSIYKRLNTSEISTEDRSISLDSRKLGNCAYIEKTSQDKWIWGTANCNEAYFSLCQVQGVLKRNGKFQTVRSKFTWKRATSNCESQGMYLAYVTEVSTTTNALFNTIPSGLKVWVGLYRHDIQLWLEDDKTLLEPKSCTVVYRDAGSTALRTKTTDCSDPLKPICQASMTLTADGPDIGTPAPTTIKTTTDGYVQDTTVQDTTVQDTTVQDTTVQDTTVQDTTEQDTTVQDTTVQDTTVQDTTVQDTTEQDTTVQDTTVQDTTVQDTTVQDTTEGPKQTKTTEMLIASTNIETTMEETTTTTESQDTPLASTTYSDITTDSQSSAAVYETTHSFNTESSTLSATTETDSTPDISSATQTMSTLPDTAEKTSIPVTTYDLTTLASTLSSTAEKTTSLTDEITTEYTTVLTDETTTNMPTTPEITTEETTTWMPTTKMTTQEETTALTLTTELTTEMNVKISTTEITSTNPTTDSTTVVPDITTINLHFMSTESSHTTQGQRTTGHQETLSSATTLETQRTTVLFTESTALIDRKHVTMMSKTVADGNEITSHPSTMFSSSGTVIGGENEKDDKGNAGSSHERASGEIEQEKEKTELMVVLVVFLIVFILVIIIVALLITRYRRTRKSHTISHGQSDVRFKEEEDLFIKAYRLSAEASNPSPKPVPRIDVETVDSTEDLAVQLENGDLKKFDSFGSVPWIDASRSTLDKLSIDDAHGTLDLSDMTSFSVSRDVTSKTQGNHHQHTAIIENNTMKSTENDGVSGIQGQETNVHNNAGQDVDAPDIEKGETETLLSKTDDVKDNSVNEGSDSGEVLEFEDTDALRSQINDEIEDSETDV